MRAIFIEVLVEKARKEHLGIAHGCLEHFVEHVDDVIKRNAVQLMNRNDFVQAYAELEEFVQRMVISAKSVGASELHEPDFFNAKGQCGLIFWCS